MEEPGEKELRIACFGRPGSYTDEAMGLYFDDRDFTAAYVPHFEDVIQAVASRKVRYGVLPIEIPRPAESPMSMTSSIAMTVVSSERNTSR